MAKLKMATLHINTCGEDSITTGARLCKFVSQYLEIPFIHNKKSSLMYMDDYDILFVRFGILMYCDYRDQLFQLYKNAKRIIALEEDYTVGADYRLTKLNKHLEVWSNMPFRVKEIGGHYINWNRMTWIHNAPKGKPYFKGLGYYGSYRDDREEYFIRYFKDAIYPIQISTFPRNALKFRDLNIGIVICDPFKNRTQIRSFESVLYIEDKFTHSHYNSPANRFYECLCLGVPLLFDKSCEGTFKKAGYVINPFIVTSQRDVKRCLKSCNEISNLQREQWYKDYYSELGRDFDKLIKLTLGEKYVKSKAQSYPKV